MVASIDHLVFVWCLLVLGCCLVVVWFVYCDCLGFAVCVWLVGYLEVGLLFALLVGIYFMLVCRFGWFGSVAGCFVGGGFGGSLLLGWFECVV